MKKFLTKIILLLLTIGFLSSCLTTKTNVGKFNNKSSTKYTFDKGKQLWLFWGLIPLGRTNVSTPESGDMQMITRFNFSDVLITGLTLGLVESYTIKVKTHAEGENNNSDRFKNLKSGDFVKYESTFKNYQAEVLSVESNQIFIKYKNLFGLKRKRKVPYSNIIYNPSK